MRGTTFDIEVIAAGQGKATNLPDGGILYAKGDHGDCAYIVTSGRVRIGNGVPIEVMEVGEIFGEMALLDDEPRTAAAVAVGRTQVLAIDRGLFDVMIRDDPDFALTVMRLMVRRLRAAMNALEANGHHREAEARVSA